MTAAEQRVAPVCVQLACAGLLITLLGACNRGGGGEGLLQEAGKAKVGGEVISTVDGRPVVAARVEQLVRASDLSKREALRRLQSELVLAATARSRGYAERAAVQEVQRKAAVHELLRRRVENPPPTEAQLRTAYAEQLPRFKRPARRASFHVLAKLPKDAGEAKRLEASARRFIEKVLAEIGEAERPGEVMAAYAKHSGEPFEVTAEPVPAFEAETSSYDQAYVQAVFSTEGVGVVDRVIRSGFGLHAIFVTLVEPGFDRSFEQARAELQAEVALALQTDRLQKLLSELRREYPVVPDEAAINHALAHAD